MDISYTLKRTSRSMRLSIAIRGKEVVVTAPKLMPKMLVDRFVASHQQWIQKALSKSADKLSVETATTLLVFGKTYQKVVIDREQQEKLLKPVKIEGTQLIIVPAQNTQESVNHAVERWLKQTAEKYLIPRTHQLAKKMDTSFGRITLKQQSSRWGSCSSKGNLNFNWRLIHYPPAIIDYVIIHELAHRTHMHHQALFWALVAKFDPHYKQHINWLKRYGTTVE